MDFLSQVYFYFVLSQNTFNVFYFGHEIEVMIIYYHVFLNTHKSRNDDI